MDLLVAIIIIYVWRKYYDQTRQNAIFLAALLGYMLDIRFLFIPLQICILQIIFGLFYSAMSEALYYSGLEINTHRYTETVAFTFIEIAQ